MFILRAGQFSWKELLLGSEEWSFLPEVVIRSLVMFAVILFGLTILGKRGVRQLSVFELVVIIGLGSAAGDPMFYREVGLLPAMLVFLMVIGLYISVTHWVGKSKKAEHLVEGKPIILIKEGRFAIRNFSKENLAQDEFFAELRLKGISQLGQVEQAIIETSGDISVFYYPDEEVKYGLPLMPGSLQEQQKAIAMAGNYACTFCGHSQHLEPSTGYKCPVCDRSSWVKASNNRRIV